MLRFGFKKFRGTFVVTKAPLLQVSGRVQNNDGPKKFFAFFGGQNDESAEQLGDKTHLRARKSGRA